jgi:hypothetical protein
VIEGSDDIIIVNALDRIEIFNMDRKGWPNIQMLLDCSSVCAEDS